MIKSLLKIHSDVMYINYNKSLIYSIKSNNFYIEIEYKFYNILKLFK